MTSAALLLGERLDLRQWIGCAVTLAAVTAVAKSQDEQTDEPVKAIVAHAVDGPQPAAE